MKTIDIFTLIIELAVLIVGLYLAFFKSYFSEKGKHLAIKEDIEEITDKVEKIKSDFQRENNEIKANIQHLLSLQKSYRDEERIAIIDFYKKYNEWLYTLLEINFGNFHRNNIQELQDLRIQIESNYKTTSIAKSTVELLVKDSEIIELARQLLIDFFEFKGWIAMRLLKLQQNLESYDSLSNQFLKIIKDYEGDKEAAMELAQNEQKLLKENKELYDEYYKNRNTEYQKILPIQKEFTEKVKTYLLK